MMLTTTTQKIMNMMISHGLISKIDICILIQNEMKINYRNEING